MDLHIDATAHRDFDVRIGLGPNGASIPATNRLRGAVINETQAMLQGLEAEMEGTGMDVGLMNTALDVRVPAGVPPDSAEQRGILR